MRPVHAPEIFLTLGQLLLKEILLEAEIILSYIRFIRARSPSEQDLFTSNEGDAAMQKLKEKRIQIVSRDGQVMTPQAAPKKSFSFFGLFSSSESNSQSHSVLLLKDPPLQKKYPVSSKADTEAIRNWVALEERIVHDYRAQKVVSSRPVIHSSRTPERERAPIFETLSVRTVTSVPKVGEMARQPSPEEKRSFLRSGTAILSLGWILAGLLAYFYAGESALRQDASLKLAESKGKSEQLEWSIAVLNTTTLNQRKEIQSLESQVRTMSGELGETKAKAAAYTAMERSYREELLRVTAQYEEQIEGMRQLVRDRENLVQTLQTHIQSIEKLVSKDGLTAVFSAAVKAVETQKNQAATKVPQSVTQQKVILRGEVVMVNRQYRFIIVNLGAEQGITTGSLIDIFQNGKFLTKGRLERVYPSMAAGTVLDEGAMEAVREGDSVSFSSN